MQVDMLQATEPVGKMVRYQRTPQRSPARSNLKIKETKKNKVSGVLQKFRVSMMISFDHYA